MCSSLSRVPPMRVNQCDAQPTRPAAHSATRLTRRPLASASRSLGSLLGLLGRLLGLRGRLLHLGLPALLLVLGTLLRSLHLEHARHYFLLLDQEGTHDAVLDAIVAARASVRSGYRLQTTRETRSLTRTCRPDLHGRTEKQLQSVQLIRMRYHELMKHVNSILNPIFQDWESSLTPRRIRLQSPQCGVAPIFLRYWYTTRPPGVFTLNKIVQVSICLTPCCKGNTTACRLYLQSPLVRSGVVRVAASVM